MDSWDAACEENRKQKEFVESYIRKHFGESSLYDAHAISEALKAYEAAIGFQLKTDDDSFILPE